MITVRIPRDNIPERAYAIHVLLYEYLGLAYDLRTSESYQDYELDLGKSKIIIRDGFFSRFRAPLEYLDQKNIPSKTHSCLSAGLEGCRLIYGEDAFQRDSRSITCGLDIFASAFFMLTRWEEFVINERDAHCRFPHTAALAVREDFIGKPVVNEYARLLAALLVEAGVDASSIRQHAFRVKLTVDVDYPFYWRAAGPSLRTYLGVLFRQRSLKGLVRAKLDYGRYLFRGKDPWDTFDKLMGLAEKTGEKVSFFFMSGGGHYHDPGFDITRRSVRQLHDRLRSAGAETGLHPSFRSAGDPEIFRVEADEWQRQVAEGELIGRQHFLRFEVPLTWRLWESHGATWESTMGYAGVPGFRCGTCLPFPVFDILARRMMSLIERPLILMDVTLTSYLELGPDDALDVVDELKRTIREHGGEFLVLWHNSSFYTDTWQGYEEVLERIIQ